MIGAYAERLCRHVFIIRAGPGARVYPDQYERSVTAHIRRAYVEFMGFAEKPSAEYVDAAVRCSNRFIRLPVWWMRRKPGKAPYWIIQKSGVDGKGKIVMAVQKEAIHDITQIFKSDGTLNVLKGMTGLTHFLGQHAAGHVAISKGVATVTACPDGSEDIVIKFKRKQ